MKALQKIYSYVAMCGLPFWGGYFYVIDIGKNGYLNNLLEKELYDEAERYLISNKFMAGFFDNGVLSPENCASFGRYDWSEYCKCYADACYRYILNFYEGRNMKLRWNNLSHDYKSWWGERMFIDETLNDFVVYWHEQMREYSPEKFLSFPIDSKIDLGKFFERFGDLVSLHDSEMGKEMIKDGNFIEVLYNRFAARFLLRENGNCFDENFLASGLAYYHHLNMACNQNVLCFKESK